MIAYGDIARTGLLLYAVYLISKVVYNVFFHPLRNIPGPLLWRMTPFPYTYHSVNGTLARVVHKLHQQYGSVVRISPSELVFCSPQAWQDIYGYKSGHPEQPEMPKYDGFYKLFDHFPRSLLNSGFHEHGKLRRQLAPGFSDRSMREQEPIIGSYVNKLISRLKTEIQKTSRQNLREWYNWTTFDLIGDLSFGVEGGFGCLDKLETHHWVKIMAHITTQSSKVQALCMLGFKQPLVWLSKSGLLADAQHRAIVTEKIGIRLKENKERPDFLDNLIKNREELGLTQTHLAMNAAILIMAGSETTASTMCGVTYFLTLHPEILKNLVREVRSTFKSDDEITLLSVGDLTYMLACLNEALRCYPPVAAGLPRQVPRGGAVIDGQFIPEGAVVSVYQWAINHDERFWTEPDKFAPERWLGDPKYKNDKFDAMQPFSVGPRNCLGRTLAYAEMRLILAKLIWNFDISIDDDSRGWLDNQKIFVLWKKPALNIHLKPAVRDDTEETVTKAKKEVVA